MVKKFKGTWMEEKKLLRLMTVFLMTFALNCISIPADRNAGTEIVYAAQAVAINSEEDLVAMQENPDGNYYLAKDITINRITKLFPRYYDSYKKAWHEECFTGSLDGKGHTIKNYTGSGLFQNATGATFKNIVMKNVTIQAENEPGAALVKGATKCSFNNITVSGKAMTDGGGIAYTTAKCNFTDCTSKVDVNVKSTEDETSLRFMGIAWGGSDSTFKNCRNKGNITLTAQSSSDASLCAYGIACSAKKIENCVNSGNITIKNTATGHSVGLEIGVCGVTGTVYGSAKGCGNTGKISVLNQGQKESRAGVNICGVISTCIIKKTVKQCYNTGAISFTGVCSGSTYEGENYIAGVGSGSAMLECYNTGKITVNTKDGFTNVGGVSSYGCGLKNSYNTGAVSLTGNGYVGGVSANFNSGSCNYNVGKVSKKGKHAYAGEIAGCVSGEHSVSDNYYTGSGKKSGYECTSWVPYQSKAKKVSSITFHNCPKLSSKYWTYSKKHKRLILKNNKEA